MSNIDKRALREAAEKATPGRWEYYPGNTSIEYNVDSMDEDQGSIVYVDSGDFTQKQTDLNGAFIAAANPATVLALLEELEAKEDQRANWFQMAQKLGDDLDAAEKRIAELEKSHAQVIQGRDHYKRMCDEGFRRINKGINLSINGEG
ncbi:TPA: ead/Ea22-like family protein [Enterobacter hormaechei]|uniref:ead/Ea22-like family protein n=1 Tax=Enterobacter hormaechei TaxID=158836 RepID=UPI001F25EB9A|nr:ead/Ea22-like family protein [Enterobacter hormaechei]